MSTPTTAPTPEAAPASPPAPEAPKPKRHTLAQSAASLAAALSKAHEEGKAPEAKPEAKPDAKAEAEAPKAEEKKPEEKRPPVSPQLAAVLERERQLLAREAKLKEAEERAAKLETARLKGDVGEALKLLGLTPQQVADYQANGNRPTPEIETKALEERVRAELEPLKQTLKQQQEAAQTQAMRQAEEAYKGDLLKLAKAGGEAFAFCASEKLGAEAMDTAVEVLKGEIARRRAEVGGRALAAHEVPTHEEILRQVEAFYEAQAERLLTINKVKAKLPPVAPQPAAPPAASKSGPRTLTNAAVAAPPAGPTSKRPTVAERKQRLEALLRGAGNSGG